MRIVRGVVEREDLMEWGRERVRRNQMEGFSARGGAEDEGGAGRCVRVCFRWRNFPQCVFFVHLEPLYKIWDDLHLVFAERMIKANKIIMGTSSRPSALHLVWHPGKTEGAPSPWSPVTHLRDPSGVPGLWPGLAQSWPLWPVGGMNQRRENLALFLPVSLCNCLLIW